MAKSEVNVCNFCDRSHKEVVWLISNGRDAGICNDCVHDCVGMMITKIGVKVIKKELIKKMKRGKKS